MSRPPPHVDASPDTHLAGVASRFFVSMRRPFSPPRRKTAENERAAMYSTPEERHAFRSSRAHSRYVDSRPTIEQIAMGLHVSRTPHLRPIPDAFHRHAFPDTSLPVFPSAPRHSLPPPPSRSSMKKSTPSASTLTQQPLQLLPPSSSSFSPGSSRPLSTLRARMSKLIPGHRPLSFPSSLGRASSFASSASDSTRPTTPRKAVRFSTSVLAIDRQS